MFEFNEPYEWIAKVAWLFVILGTIAFAIGAVQLAVSGGDEKRSYIAKMVMKRSIIGIVIIVMSIALTRLMINFVS